MPYLIVIVLIILLISLIITYWPIALALAVALAIPRVVRYIRKRRYFSSDLFLAHKSEIASVVAEHNDIATYARALRSSGGLMLGATATGAQAHLASFENTSHHNYRRRNNFV